MWSFVYDHYHEDYDCFHIGGDDMFPLVENMRLYLESEEVALASNEGIFLPSSTKASSKQQRLYIGGQFYLNGKKKKALVNGRGGYTLNKAALKALVLSFPTCLPNLTMPNEDMNVAFCFREKGILPFETKYMNGADSYMHMDPEFYFNFDPKKNPRFWCPKFNPLNRNAGPDHVAERSVSFHYVKGGDAIRRVHSILYGYCARLNVTLGPPVPTKWKDGRVG